MEKTTSGDNNDLIQNYQQTNKLLRSRAVLMAILFLIVLGLQHSTKINKEKANALNRTVYLIEELTKSNDVQKTLDSLESSMALYDYYIVKHIHIQPQIEKLKFELKKSDYKDKTPIFQCISDLEIQKRELGVTSSDYKISVFGVNTSFSDWLYFAPVILLLLYHDMTRTILYRRKLKTRLIESNVEKWKLGTEIFETEEEEKTSTGLFMSMVTNLLVIILFILPIIPALIGAISYIEENGYSDINAFMIIVQWISPIIMTIEMIIIYHSENLLKVRDIVFFFRKLFITVPTKTAVFMNFLIAFSLILFLFIIDYYSKKDPKNGIDFFITIITTLLILPISSLMLLRKPLSYFYRGLRMTGRFMLSFWLFFFIGFIFSKPGFYYSRGTVIINVLIIFLIATIASYINFSIIAKKERQKVQ